jgi:hypothetical protein
LVSKKTEDKILNYIADHKGLATKNDIVKYIHEDLSRPSTLKLIDKLEFERKITIRRGRKGLRHQLKINDNNRFTRIKQELSSLENFIIEINRYLQRRDEETGKEIYNDLLRENKDKDRATKMNNQISFVNCLYYHYYDIFRRMLDNLFYITTMSDLSKEDSEEFLKQIIELRSQLKYKQWNKVDAKDQLKRDISKINNLIRRSESSGLQDYIEKKQIKNKFVEPLIRKINDFIVLFLD